MAYATVQVIEIKNLKALYFNGKFYIDIDDALKINQKFFERIEEEIKKAE